MWSPTLFFPSEAFFSIFEDRGLPFFYFCQSIYIRFSGTGEGDGKFLYDAIFFLTPFSYRLERGKKSRGQLAVGGMVSCLISIFNRCTIIIVIIHTRVFPYFLISVSFGRVFTTTRRQWGRGDPVSYIYSLLFFSFFFPTLCLLLLSLCPSLSLSLPLFFPRISCIAFWVGERVCIVITGFCFFFRVGVGGIFRFSRRLGSKYVS